MKYPEFLKTGSGIGITAPSGGTETNIDLIKIELATKNINEHGFKTKITKNCYTNYEGRSSNTNTRIKELQSLFLDNTVNSIICLAGGEFLLEILTDLDFEIIKKHPKWIQGYSDITGLLFPITTKLDIATIYGANFKAFAMRPWHQSLENNMEILKGNIVIQNSFDKYRENRQEYITGDEAYKLDSNVYWENLNGEEKITMSGRVIGGCLDVLVSLIGTRFDYVKDFIRKYKEDGIIWYFDNCELTSESLIRSMWQLKEAGWFEHTKGIIFGRSGIEISSCNISFKDAIKTSLNDLNVPIIINADIGHKPPQISMINGAIGTIVSNKGKGTIKFELK